jgi:hypothetical protein
VTIVFPLGAAFPDLRLTLVLPVTRIGFGAFSVDPLARLIGAPVADILEPLIVGEVRREVGRNGNLVERFPLAIPDGEGLAVPLGSFGSFGARNDHGTLVLTVPSPLVPWLSPRLGADLVDGPRHRPSDGGGMPVADLWVRLRAGVRFTMPLGALGELGVEAGG